MPTSRRPATSTAAGAASPRRSSATSGRRTGDRRALYSAVLRRVEAGERLRVTVGGRPVAELSPLPTRPRSLPWGAFLEGADDWRADAGLAPELQTLLPDTTDDA